MTSSSTTRRIAEIRETRAEGPVPRFVHPDWADRFPWLVQGTTGTGAARGDRGAGGIHDGRTDGGGFDLRLFGPAPVGDVLERWRRLRETTGCPSAVHARQVHGARVLSHGPVAPGLLIVDDADGHATREPGLLLTVSVADCVPISLVDPERRAVALLHGGWRGAAAGILGQGLAALRGVAGTEPADLITHFGPAICGACYEVGPEVHEALGLPRPSAPEPIDLRAVLARQAIQFGVRPGGISVSAYCTRCGGPEFHSHRGGSEGRQVGYLAVAGEGSDA